MTAAYQAQIAAAKAAPPAPRPASGIGVARAAGKAVAGTNQGRTACTEIEFPGKVPGNNGAGGLLRMHWARKKALAAVYGMRVFLQTRAHHAGPVRLELIRYSTGRPMDYDNLVSTGKLLIDAIVRAGVLPDDNPAIITERSYTQQRAASKEAQRTVIRITNL